MHTPPLCTYVCHPLAVCNAAVRAAAVSKCMYSCVTTQKLAIIVRALHLQGILVTKFYFIQNNMMNYDLLLGDKSTGVFACML